MACIDPHDYDDPCGLGRRTEVVERKMTKREKSPTAW